MIHGCVCLESIRNKNNCNNATKGLLGCYSHSGNYIYHPFLLRWATTLKHKFSFFNCFYVCDLNPFFYFLNNRWSEKYAAGFTGISWQVTYFQFFNGSRISEEVQYCNPSSFIPQGLASMNCDRNNFRVFRLFAGLFLS